MTTLELLRQRAPNLAAFLDRADARLLRRVSSSIAHAVVERSGLRDPLITEALEYLKRSVASPPELRTRVQSLAERLDSHYFDLQDLSESGKATETELQNAFARARAATAVASALGDDASTAAAETAYEAVVAIESSEDYITGVAKRTMTK